MIGFLMLGIVGHRYKLAGNPLQVIDADQISVQILLGCIHRVRHDPGNRLFILAETADNHFPESVRRFHAVTL